MTGTYMENQLNIIKTAVPTTYTVVQPPVVKAETVDLGHEKLLSCLYFLFDSFSRSQMEFFLVKDTAKQAMKNDNLTGDHIDIGVRKLEWENGNNEMLEMYFDQERVKKVLVLPQYINYQWQDIPFTISLYTDSPSVTALIPIAYENESFSIPNQFEAFEKQQQQS